jgi:hypothetical protein
VPQNLAARPRGRILNSNSDRTIIRIVPGQSVSNSQPRAGGSVSTSEDGVRLTDEERLDWLRLIRSENVGPRGIMAQTPQAF